MKKTLKNIKLEFFDVEEGNKKELEKIIDNVKEKNIIVNLTGGKRINSLILLDLCIKEKLTAVYIDIKKQIMYEFKDNIEIYEKTFERFGYLMISLRLLGGKIVEDFQNYAIKKI